MKLRSPWGNQPIDEERRLFYVGITRAREKLYLMHAEKRYRFGEITYPPPSVFLDEISEDAHQLTVIGVLKTLPGKFTVLAFRGYGC